MIIQYDTRPNATIDEKLKSLIESIQLAFGEVGIKENAYQTSQDVDMNAVVTMLREFSETIGTLNAAVINLGDSVGTLEDTTIPGIQGDISDLDEALDTLETTVGGHTTAIAALDAKLPAAPAVDGAYKLTVTVTDGEPVYTWEAV